MVKLNARCSAFLQKELPPKEKDPGSFVLPFIIGNTTVSNALANLEASISVMSFSMFKLLEQVTFNAKEGATPVTVSHVCVIKDFDVNDNFGGPEDLEQLLTDDDINKDLGNFLKDNDLLPDYEDPGTILLSPNKSLGKKWDPVGDFQDSNGNLGVGIYNFVANDDL
nr:hypothetical protein [Tanacetum cinerariifolium]